MQSRGNKYAILDTKSQEIIKSAHALQCQLDSLFHLASCTKT